MKVYVVAFEKEDDFEESEFEVVGVYATEDLAEKARIERAKEEDPDDGEFSISIEEFEVVEV